MPNVYQTSAEGHRGTRAVRRLLEYAPASGSLALWMRHRDVDAVPAGTRGAIVERGAREWLVGNDGRTVWYGPAFERRTLAEQTGLVAHQVLHVALRHAPRERALRGARGDVDGALWNLCADAIVDTALSHLEWLALPPGAIRLEELLERLLGERTTADASLLRWDVESLYRAIDDRAAARGTPDERAGGRGAGGRRSDDERPSAERTPRARARVDGPLARRARALLDPERRDLLPAADDAPETEASETREWSARLERAHAADGTQSLLRQLLADRPTPRTPWERLLRTRLARSLAPRPELSWSRPTRSWLANGGRTANGRRLPWTPGTSGARAVPRLAVVVDVSGSVEPKTLGRFARELDRLMRVHRAEIRLLVGDDRVRHETRLSPGCRALLELEVEGGGGTDFAPLLARAGEWRPDAVVVLTDLEGPTGPPPPWPVIWALPPGRPEREAPFGRVLVLD